jgi:hypothetical protein
MKKVLLTFMSVLLSAAVFAQQPNTLTKKEKREGWKLLFDGKTTNGWHTYLKDGVSKSWSVADGELMFNPEGGDGGDLITNDEYENYDLTLEWKVEEGVNSGIIFNVKEDPKYRATYITGPEMQVLDNIKAADNKVENHLAGSLYDIMGSAATSKPKPVGEWNQVRILQNNGQLTLFLNGIKTADVDFKSEEWQTLKSKSKFRNWKDFAAFSKGRIAFQDHGGKVSFRNIKIKQL